MNQIITRHDKQKTFRSSEREWLEIYSVFSGREHFEEEIALLSRMKEEAGGAEEKEDLPPRGLSHHCSNSSLGDKTTTSPKLQLDLTLAFAANHLDDMKNKEEKDRAAAVGTPAPFPLSSNIGTGLYRQNSLQR